MSGGELIKVNNNLQENNNITWETHGEDVILNLGTMRKAIVIRGYLNQKTGGLKVFSVRNPDYFSISVSSFFPFSDNDYERKFNNSYECKEYAISKIREWFKSIFI
jgi:predicted phosphohydrolase